jgi:hypothetical protein
MKTVILSQKEWVTAYSNVVFETLIKKQKLSVTFCLN